MSKDLSIEVRDGLLQVTLDRPEKHNAISHVMVAALTEQVARFNQDPNLQVLLLRARGRFFSAGGDVNSAIFPDLSHNSPLQLRNWLKHSPNSLTPLVELVAACEKPTVVAHQGPCLGGALELSLAFDFRVCSAEASFALPETRFGAVPVTGGVARLTKIVGPNWARWLLVAGETVGAHKAEQIGLVHAVHAPEVFEDEVDAFCDRLLAMPPEVASAAKLAIDLADDLGTAGGRSLERIVSSSLLFGAEYRTELSKVVERLGRKC